MFWGVLIYSIYYMEDVIFHLVHIFMCCWFDTDLKLLMSAILLNIKGLMPLVDNWSIIDCGHRINRLYEDCEAP